MELRGQSKETGMPSSLVYSPPNRDSGGIPSASVVSALGEGRRDHQNQTIEHRSLYHHQQLNLQHQSHKHTRDPDPTPDPAPAQVPVPASNVVKSAVNSTLAPSRSISRSPPPTSTTTTTAPAQPSVRYRECLKNHAATMGGHVVDGCGEFMPSGEEGTLEALKCAACECHRNFHRKEIDGDPQHVANSHHTNNCRQRVALPSPNQHIAAASPAQPQPSLPQNHRYAHGLFGAYTGPNAPVMMSFGGGVLEESSSEDLDMFQSAVRGQQAVQPSSSKKRFRTKFSQEQKDKMMEFAEKLGWRIQKQDEQEVLQFCSQVGVRRKVFKVWMHNNKQAIKKKQM